MSSSKDDIQAGVPVKPYGDSQNGVYNPPKAWPGSRIEANQKDDQLKRQCMNKRNHLFTFMSKEELKIRDEIEEDIERDLEEEIKEEIYHMALKLHRLYTSKNHARKQKNQKTLSEVSIGITMEGGTKIEIKETKRQASKSDKPPRTMVVNGGNYGNKFDWEKSLRSGKVKPVVINKRSERSCRPKTASNM